MKKTVFFIFIMSMVLLTAIWQPVYASSGADGVQSEEATTTVNATKLPKLTVNNKTGQNFTLTLRGPKTYYLTVPSGKSNFEVEQGKYTYSYTACGGPQTGSVSVKKSGSSLKLECPKAKDKNKNIVKVTVNNKTGGYIYITLTGPKTYNFTLGPGKGKIEVEKGKYNFTVRGCGGASSSGTRNFKGSFVWTWFCTP